MTASFLAAILLMAPFTPLSAQEEFSSQDRQVALKKLQTYFLNKKLTAKVVFPAYVGGIDLSIDGAINQRLATRYIKDKGVGVEVGEAVVVTAVNLKGKHVEIHLNGGGQGTLGDVLMESEDKRHSREKGTGKVPGGSRVNLRFGRPVTMADIDNLDALIGFLEPVLDCSSLRQAAALQSLAPEFKDAAQRGDVVAGMDKATVFAILGEPKNKSVDMNSDPPTEKWQYDAKNMATKVLTFKSGKLAQIQVF